VAATKVKSEKVKGKRTDSASHFCLFFRSHLKKRKDLRREVHLRGARVTGTLGAVRTPCPPLANIAAHGARSKSRRKSRHRPTQPQEGTPPQQSPLISDHDTILKSHNKTSRAPDEPLPDVTGHKDHSLDLQSQAASRPSKSQPATPPTPQKEQQKQEEKTAAKPNKATKPAPPDPSAIKPTDNPEKGQDSMVAKYKPSDQQVDANGLPVLPPIDAATLAPQTPQTQPIPQIQRQATPKSVPSFAVYQSDVQGQAGAPGDNSPAAMATDLGRYKAKVYRAVGALWYNKVNNQLQVLGVGTVHITYTIYADGHMVITGDPDGGNQALMLLHSLSINSMTEAAPFDHFSDKMQKEVGDSYTDDFSFSIYGN
jgi:hypothetical protein